MSKYTGNLEKDLKVLLPYAVASGVSYEHSDRLVSIAKQVYAANPSWAKHITDTNKGRDTLHAFMEHWYDAYKLTGYWIDERKVA